MKRYLSLRLWLAGLSVLLMAIPLQAQAGNILISGSDNDVFHGHAPYATDVRDFLDQGSALPVLVLGGAPATGAYSTAVGGVGIVTTASLGAITLSNYSALYLLSDSANGAGCCQADVALIVGFEAAINAFLAGGGSFGIQAYTGQAGFDPILGTVGANADVFGFMGGLGGTINYDNEAVTAAGIAAGFANYPPSGSWGHQGFRMSYFGGLGYVSLIDAPVYGANVSGLMAVELPIQVDIDIKFCSDPNAHNCKNGGVLPVTIFGTADLDVLDIDLESLQLCNDIGCTDPGLRDWSFADRGDPSSDLGAAMCAIDPATGLEEDFLNPDGFLDLDAAFDKRAVSDLLGVCAGGSKNDSSLPLFIQGSLLDGTPILSTPVFDDGIDQLVRKNK